MTPRCTTASAPPAPFTDDYWDLEFAVELAEPDSYSFGDSGDLPVYGDDVGTETVTLEMRPFALKGDTVQATGSIVIITSPWAPTKTGTLTIILTQSREDRGS